MFAKSIDAGANLSGANLTNVEISEDTNFTDTILPDAFPLTKIKHSSGIDSTNQIENNEPFFTSTKSIHRITKYTSDGKLSFGHRRRLARAIYESCNTLLPEKSQAYMPPIIDFKNPNVFLVHCQEYLFFNEK
ncbi:MAG: hypothetical protein DLM72_13165 [Candidatus Nitrosopolaris wilkensis]|nr:MAG: hypothetical protein DLM72_13165 [Candidatus Nitrosopolaris wilkensis]